jgi:hypothetical protein
MMISGRKPKKNLEKYLLHCHFSHHKHHMKALSIEPEAGADKPVTNSMTKGTILCKLNLYKI